MSLFPRFPFRKVKTSVPIDWQQWQLTESVRNLHLEADADGDLYALPVIIIDPTKEKVSAIALWRGIWTDWVDVSAIGNQVIHNAGTATSRLLGLWVDYANSAVGAAAKSTIFINERGGASATKFQHEFYTPAAALPRPSFVIDFSNNELWCTYGVSVLNMQNFGATNIQVGAWGYDVA